MRGRIALVIMLGLSLALGSYNTWRLHFRQSPQTIDQQAYSRVMERSELRVGYLVLPPYLNKDASSGKLSGIFYDVTEELGKRLELRVVWVEEANLATLSAGIDSGRYDLIAFPLWRSAARAKNVAFSTPLFYSLVGTYVREGDTRFDMGLDKLNDPSITVSAIDGELAATIAATDFPKARINSLPNLSDYSQLLLEVATGKADVTFFNRVVARRYIRNNPGKVREVPLGRPVRVFAECLILPIGDVKLQHMINASLLEMIENGAIERIFAQHGEDPKDYFFPITPYR